MLRIIEVSKESAHHYLFPSFLVVFSHCCCSLQYNISIDLLFFQKHSFFQYRYKIIDFGTNFLSTKQQINLNWIDLAKIISTKRKSILKFFFHQQEEWIYSQYLMMNKWMKISLWWITRKINKQIFVSSHNEKKKKKWTIDKLNITTTTIIVCKFSLSQMMMIKIK